MAQALRLLNKGLSFKSYPNINIIGLKLCLPEFLLELSAQPDQLKDDGTGSHHSKPKQQQNHLFMSNDLLKLLFKFRSLLPLRGEEGKA